MVDLGEQLLRSASAPTALPGWLPPGPLRGPGGRTARAEPEARRQEVGLNIGSRTILAAAIATRSRTVGMDRGRDGLPGGSLLWGCTPAPERGR